MNPFFTADDLSVFDIDGFAERMATLKMRIRPKLEALGDLLAPRLGEALGRSFHPHTAKHLRRKVNPPDETWVALGPSPKGYKAYVHFALCVGKRGVQARVVMKDESPTRPRMGERILSSLSRLRKSIPPTLTDFSRGEPRTADLGEAAKRLIEVKSAMFDVGVSLNPTSKTLAGDFLKRAEHLYPLFECGVV